ncbi:MAG: hypothetical protein ACXACY_21650 [Candidatus Hodarchaeales archaeon]|jgi:hypothetical protein
MKIRYEPFPGFNNRHDFLFSNDAVENLSFIEPEEPKLIRKIGVDYIVKEVVKDSLFKYSFTRSLLMEQLLPEQIRVLLSHAYKISGKFIRKSQFVREFRNEVEQIAKQEIEPGIFKDEDKI